MATTVGKLRIILTANAGRFNKTMNRASDRLGKFARSSARFALKISGIGAALGAVFGGARIVSYIRESASLADQLAKTAGKLGLTTEALAGMRLAAELSGVDIRTMEMGLQRMTRRMSEAAKDTGEAKAAIKELGLDAKALNQLSPDKMFQAIADAMEKVQNPADRLRLAVKLFDTEGAALVNTLALGNDKLKELAKLTKKLGTGISGIDAAKIELMNDSFTLLRQTMRGLATQIAVQLTPFIEGLSTALFNVGTDGIEMSREVKKAFVWLGQNIISIASTIDTVFSTLSLNIELGFREAIKSVVDSMIVLKGAMGPFKLITTPDPEATRANIDRIKELQTLIAGGEEEAFKRQMGLINAIGDKLLEFNRRARNRISGPGGFNENVLEAAGAKVGGSSIIGRTRQQGFIEAGGVLGVQKIQTAKYIQNTAQNTKTIATILQKTFNLQFTGQGVPVVVLDR